HDPPEVKAEDPIPPRHAWARDVQGDDETAGHGDAPHLGEAAREICEVTHEEGRGHRRERAIVKRQRERIGGEQPHARLAAPREPREHRANGARGLAFYHQRPPTTDASTMTAM